MRLLNGLALALLLLVTACGRGAPDARPTVLAAASLTEAFGDVGGATFSFAGSQALAAQIERGAPADVFAAADEQTMQRLVDADLVERPEVFARNTLAIAVRPGNPAHVRGLADLTRAGLTVVLADPSVPVGAYSAQALAKAGVTVRAASLELDVKAALTRVRLGEADATIVYVTDVQAAAGAVSGVSIPAADNVLARYPIAVVTKAPHHRAAAAFVEEVLSTRAQRALQRRGFLPAR